MDISWKTIFRQHLFDTKRGSNLFTQFDIKKNISLLELTEITEDFDLEVYMKAWNLQGDEKYNNIESPRDSFLYVFPETLICITRTHAINTSLITDYKDCQVFQIIVIDKKYNFKNYFSSLQDNIYFWYDNQLFLEIDSPQLKLKIKDSDLILNNTKHLNVTPKISGNLSEESYFYEMLYLEKLSKRLQNGGIYQHFRWKTKKNKLAPLVGTITNSYKINKMLNVIESKNGIINIVTIRDNNITPENKKLNTIETFDNIEIYKQFTNKTNWTWTIYIDPTSINLNKLYPPLESPKDSIFLEKHIDTNRVITICVLFFVIILSFILFIVQDYLPELPNPPEDLSVSFSFPKVTLPTPFPQNGTI